MSFIKERRCKNQNGSHPSPESFRDAANDRFRFGTSTFQSGRNQVGLWKVRFLVCHYLIMPKKFGWGLRVTVRLSEVPACRTGREVFSH